MVLNGDIDRESYSLYLNDQANGNGVIIFGGVDTTKYTGDLVALQVLPTNNGYSATPPSTSPSPASPSKTTPEPVS